MAASSSTSSSDPAGGRAGSRVPWAFLLAIVIVIAFEVFLRTRSPRELIAYPELDSAADQTITYVAAREYIDAEGPADVALVGSSQMREGIVMPNFTALLREEVGRDVSVANYATRGARVPTMEAVVRHLLRQDHPPEVIIIGMSARDLRTHEFDIPRLAVFWNPADWWRELHVLGWPVLEQWTSVAQTQAGRLLYTLRYREQLARELTKPFAFMGIDLRREGNPIIGEITFQHTGSRGRRSIDEWRVPRRRMLRLAMDSYAWDEPARPHPAMVERLRSMINMLDQSKTRAIIVEMPVSQHLQPHLDHRGLTRAFDETLRQATAGTSVRYLPVEKRELELTDDDFIDMQHTNRYGANRFGNWLARRLAQILGQP